MTSKHAVLCFCILGLLGHDAALARRHGVKQKQDAPDYTALAMADQIASERLTAVTSGQALPVSEPVALAENLDDLPPTGAGRMSMTMRVQPASREVEPVPSPASTATPNAEKATGKYQKKSMLPIAIEKRQEGEPRFDLSISNAPAEQVFMQLGAGTSYNVLVSQGVTGMVSLQLKNVTVLEALEALRDLYGYEFKVTGKRVMVFANTVQTRIFKINYLPGRRQGSSDLRVSNNSVSDAGGSSDKSSKADSKGGKSQDGNTATNSAQVRTSSDSDFWQELKDSLSSMMATDGGRSVVINPSAGVIVVRATPAEHRAVADFLKAIQVTIERQVMLEAKIIEVTLSSGSQTGVNWTNFKGTAGDNLAMVGAVGPGITLGNGTIKSGANTITPGVSISTDSATQGFYGLAIQASNFTALINFLETQGDVQVLSSPRIATINSQKAILKVGSDEFFVTGLKTEVTPGTNGGSPVVSPTITVQPFFSGIALDVTPQIDEEGSVILHVHPAVSAVSTKNKVVDLGDLGQFKLPLAASSINETDSIVRVQDGQIVAIGGLMSESSTLDRQGLKGLSHLPVVGNFLFGQKGTENTKRELVILIKPTIIGDDGAGWTRDMPATSALSSNR